MMPKIKFSHMYEKMPIGESHGTLLEVLIADKKELSESFIQYDTTYLEWNWVGNLRHPEIRNYPLPNGKIIILLILSEHQKRLWTTIRRWTQEKEVYYKSLRGKSVEIEINEVK